ncbi:alpha/beta hydrolase [Streptosporangium roseum]|uniref:alpha/beta hydrolase n=1 Tax=Streptosporangium roseum TaxID=2001 RepID=UPI00331EB8AA
MSAGGNGPAAPDSSLPLKSGAVMHTWTTGSPCGVVVLQHGFGEYAERYAAQHARLVPHLLEAGFEVRALDLWGHGRSPGRRAVTSVRLAVGDHLAVRQAAAQPGLPTVLLGHSLGALVTAGSALAAPEGLAGVVLLSPSLPREPALVRRTLGAVASVAPWAPLPRRRSPVGALSRIPSVGQRASADPLMFDGQVTMLTAATALDTAERLRAGLADWRVPTLLVHGTADTYTDPAAGRAFADAIASPDKAVHLIEGAYHELLNDSCADQVLGLILRWMGDHT